MTYEEIKQKRGAQAEKLRRDIDQAQGVVLTFEKAAAEAHRRKMANYPRTQADYRTGRYKDFLTADTDEKKYRAALEAARGELAKLEAYGMDFEGMAVNMVDREAHGLLSHPVGNQ